MSCTTMTLSRPPHRVVQTSTVAFTLAFSLTLAGCGGGPGSQQDTAPSASSQTGVLANIVVPDTHSSLLPGANGVELSTSMSVTDVTTFFEDNMPSKGWMLAAPVVPKPNSAVIYFEQGARNATVHIRRPPGRDATLVQVILS